MRSNQPWQDSVRDAIHRLCFRNQSEIFTLKELRETELYRILHETRTHSKTPRKSLEITLQQLRDIEEIEFVDNNGSYRLKITEKLGW